MGKFKPFNSQVHHAGWLEGLTTIHKTLRLLGIAAEAICILKLYPHFPGRMQPLLCDQRQGSWKPGFPFRLCNDSTHQGTTQAKAQEAPPLLALWSQCFAKSTLPIKKLFFFLPPSFPGQSISICLWKGNLFIEIWSTAGASALKYTLAVGNCHLSVTREVNGCVCLVCKWEYTGQRLERLEEGRGISDPQRNAVAFL